MTTVSICVQTCCQLLLPSSTKTSIRKNKSLKNSVGSFRHFWRVDSCFCSKRTEQNGKKNGSGFQNDSFYFAKWAVLLAETAHSAQQNGPFPSVEWAILQGSIVVKKIQLLQSQRIKKSSYFANFGPPDFYFQIIDSQSTFSSFLSAFFSEGNYNDCGSGNDASGIR